MDISISNLQALVGVVLAGSLIMERLVTAAKTLLPRVFGDPGPAPDNIFRPTTEAGRSLSLKGAAPRPDAPARLFTWYTKYQIRRIYVTALVLSSSIATSLFLATGSTFLKRVVSYGPNDRIHFLVFALLISGGSAFWTQVVGVLGAVKDHRAHQAESGSGRAPVIVVNKADPPTFDHGGDRAPRE